MTDIKTTIATLKGLGEQLKSLETSSDQKYAAQLLEWIRSGELDRIHDTVDAFVAKKAGAQAQQALTKPDWPVDAVVGLNSWMAREAAKHKLGYMSVVSSHIGNEGFTFVRNLSVVVAEVQDALSRHTPYDGDDVEFMSTFEVRDDTVALIRIPSTTPDLDIGYTITFNGTPAEVKELSTLLHKDALAARHLTWV
ncbi:Hypothetical protein POVN_LOCUS332 [uncultured virus]|nr:Hypothetical protein POVN_LOCUS332 [uncultured virus]